MKNYDRGSLNEVANTYKKMILEEYIGGQIPRDQEGSPTGRRPAWNPMGDTPFIPPTPKPTPKPPVIPDDLEDLPFDLSPDLPDRPDVYRAPGTKPPMRLPALKPGTPGGVGGVGRFVWPALLGYHLGTEINDTFIDPMYRPAKPTPNQLRPVPTEILPSPESLYPRPSQPILPGGNAGGGRSSGGSSSGGGMGGM